MDQSLSLEIGHILGDLGFSEERIKERRLSNDKLSLVRTLITRKVTQNDDYVQIVGSRREGTGLLSISDTDILLIYAHVRCVESTGDCNDDEYSVFKLVKDLSFPGHYLLQLLTPSSKHIDKFQYALVEENNNTFISSELFMQRIDDFPQITGGWLRQSTHYGRRTGPSIPKYTYNYQLDWLQDSLGIKLATAGDYVRGFPCHCPSVIEKWRQRVRHYDWPSQDDIDTVLTLPACVVPVGEKQSPRQHLHWRLCFNLGEIHLIKSMNITHTQVQVLLKLIAKHYLKPVWEDTTSYMMKNIIFWLAEMIPVDKFRPEYLLDRLADALFFFRDCLSKRELPYYWIPERNLLSGRVSDSTNTVVMDKLNHLLKHLYTYSARLTSGDVPDRVHDEAFTIACGNIIDRMNTCRVSAASVKELVEFMESISIFRPENVCYFRLLNEQFVSTYLVPKYGYHFEENPLQIPHKIIVDNLDEYEIENEAHKLIWQTIGLNKVYARAKGTFEITGSDIGDDHDTGDREDDVSGVNVDNDNSDVDIRYVVDIKRYEEIDNVRSKQCKYIQSSSRETTSRFRQWLAENVQKQITKSHTAAIKESTFNIAQGNIGGSMIGNVGK